MEWVLVVEELTESYGSDSETEEGDEGDCDKAGVDAD